jgi:myo-inositol 2-dehydrogenase/D-chiro-inositol 1-dehydrogenase
MNRRQFLQTGAAAVPSILLLKPKTVFGYEANSAVRLGLLGCGDRGKVVATSFAQNTCAQVVALADIFADKLESGKQHFDKVNADLGRTTVDAKMLFSGAHAYERLAQRQDVDVVQISTPPFFHVQHLDAAVAGDKHVYCEKPVGIDVRQARQALEIAKRVKPNRSVDVGFQCRNAPPLAAVANKVKSGAIGAVACVTGNYFSPALKEKARPGITADEYRLRNWLWDRALSGDILVEQNIHIIDLCNWMVGSRPTKAAATGGRNVLKHWGDCWDNYQVDFTYPGDVHFSFASTQFGVDGVFDAGLKLLGAKGIATAPYAGLVHLTGENAWTWSESTGEAEGGGKFAANGAFTENLKDADREKERSFIDSVVKGPAHNEIAEGVRSALSCMLGRMAGYRHAEVTWDELLRHGDTYELGFSLNQFA